MNIEAVDLTNLGENVGAVFFRLFARLPLEDYSTALCYIAFGLIAGKLVYVLLSGVLDLLRFNRLCEMLGLYEVIEERARDLPSRLVGRLAYWCILAFCLIGAVDSLNFVDVPLMFEAFVGITSRVLCFFIILVLADIVGSVLGSVADSILVMADHSFAGRSARPLRFAIVTGAAFLGLELIGIDPATSAGQSVLALVGIFVLVSGIVLLLRWQSAAMLASKLRERFRVGDRVAIHDGKAGVVRRIERDHLIVATESEEYVIPAAWLVDAPVKREPI